MTTVVEPVQWIEKNRKQKSEWFFVATPNGTFHRHFYSLLYVFGRLTFVYRWAILHSSKRVSQKDFYFTLKFLRYHGIEVSHVKTLIDPQPETYIVVFNKHLFRRSSIYIRTLSVHFFTIKEHLKIFHGDWQNEKTGFGSVRRSM